MATTTTTQASHPIDDEYIDMEIISSSSSSLNFFPHSLIGSPTHRSNTTKEFEFQMSSVPNQDKETSTFPADELFYKGKLLPLHLPPRLQMVQNILQNSNTRNTSQEEEEGFEEVEEEEEEETFTIPFNMINRRSVSITAPCTNTTNTPLESCNISPSESCRVSCELNPDEYLSQWSSSNHHHDEVKRVFNFIGGGGSSSSSKKYYSSWSTKLMKQFSLGRKLKASRAFVKSFFSKSNCNNNGGESDHQYHDQININSDSKKNPFGKMQISSTLMKRIENEVANSHHRKSFSGVIQRHISSSSFGATSAKSSSLSSSTSTSSTGSSSSSSIFSLSSNGCCYDHLQLMKRNGSASSELESSIEGAIAHCKQSSSQQFFSSRKSTNNYQDGIFSLSNSASPRTAV